MHQLIECAPCCVCGYVRTLTCICGTLSMVLPVLVTLCSVITVTPATQRQQHYQRPYAEALWTTWSHTRLNEYLPGLQSSNAVSALDSRVTVTWCACRVARSAPAHVQVVTCFRSWPVACPRTIFFGIFDRKVQSAAHRCRHNDRMRLDAQQAETERV